MAEDVVSFEPEFTYDRGVALVTWKDAPPFGISMLFTEIRTERRTAEVSAEVQVFGGSNGSASDPLHRGRLNMTSTRARSETAKFLEHQLQGPDWPARLEQACWKVVDRHRKGRPGILLRDAQSQPDSDVILPPLLLAREPVMVFGDGGGWKSYFGLSAALSIHMGRDVVPGLMPTSKLRVAYLDWEWKEGKHKQRMVRLLGSAELPDLVYVPCLVEGPLVHQVDRLRNILREHRIEYVVMDSVALACDGPPEEAQVALTFFQALSRLEVGSLLIAHVNKLGDIEKPFGSSFWHNSARATWYAKASHETEQAIDVGLFHRKANDGPLVKPIGLHVDFTEGRTLVTRTDITGVPDLAAGLSLKDQIWEAIGSGALSCEDLAQQLGKTVENIRVVVNRHEGRTFKKLPGGKQYLVMRMPK